MSKVTTVNLPQGKEEIHNYVIAGDWHSQFINDHCYTIIKQFGLTLPEESRALIINGDFLDAPFLMKKNPDFRQMLKARMFEEHFVELAVEELMWGNVVLDELQAIFPKIILIEGNHDWRYRWFMDLADVPHAYKHHFDIEKRLRLKERGIPYVYYNDWLDIGDLSVTHGMFHGVSALKRHYEASGGRNVIFSHVHHSDAKSFRARGTTVKAWSLPAMCDLNPEYIKNTDNNWTNGFGSIHIKSNGHFNMHIHEVWDGELILPNGIKIKG